jgi:hypothetical protein
LTRAPIECFFVSHSRFLFGRQILINHFHWLMSISPHISLTRISSFSLLILFLLYVSCRLSLEPFVLCLSSMSKAIQSLSSDRGCSTS